MRLLHILAAAGLLVAPFAAYADTYAVYDVSGYGEVEYPKGDGTYNFYTDSVTGTAIFDVTTQQFTVVNAPSKYLGNIDFYAVQDQSDFSICANGEAVYTLQ